MNIKKVEIEDENWLRDYIIEHPNFLEEGVKILSQELHTDSGRMDILAVDSDGAAIVVELKVKVDEGQLDQALCYYDWLRTNLFILASVYNDIDPKSTPRIILVAPRFSERLKRIAKYIDAPINLVEYRAIKISNDIVLIPEIIEIPPPPEPPIPPTRKGHLKYIEDEEIRKLCDECMKTLEKVGVKFRPLKNYWFSGWYQRKRFMSLGCKKHFFVVFVERVDGTWSERYRIQSIDDWNKVMKEEIIPRLKTLGYQENSEKATHNS